MSAESARLPGNSQRTSSNDMPTPKTRLITTAESATTAVSFSACVTSGSVSAVLSAVMPSAKVYFTTSETGQITRKNT